MMETDQIRNVVEACLLVAGRPMTVAQLEALFEDDEGKPDRAAIREALVALADGYAGRGIELVEVAGGWRLQTRAAMEHWIARLFAERPPRYSRALLETLVLIAYRQPITRGEIEEVRGVAVSSNIVRTLQDRRWVREVGHKDVPGKPALLGTTSEFLDYFNLRRLDDLPALGELADMNDIETRLAAEFGVVDEAGEAANDDAEMPAVDVDGDTAPGEGTGATAPAGEVRDGGADTSVAADVPHDRAVDEGSTSGGVPTIGADVGTGAGTDSEIDVAPEAERGAATEAGFDVEPEAGIDSGSAAESDVESEADIDAVREAGTDAGSDLETVAESDVELEAEINAEPEAGIDTGSDLETVAESDVESKADIDAELRAGIDAGSDSETEAESDVESEANVDAEREAGIDAEPEVETEAEPEAEIDAGTVAGTDTDGDADAGAGIGPDSGREGGRGESRSEDQVGVVTEPESEAAARSDGADEADSRVARHAVSAEAGSGMRRGSGQANGARDEPPGIDERSRAADSVASERAEAPVVDETPVASAGPDGVRDRDVGRTGDTGSGDDGAGRAAARADDGPVGVDEAGAARPSASAEGGAGAFAAAFAAEVLELEPRLVESAVATPAGAIDRDPDGAEAAMRRRIEAFADEHRLEIEARDAFERRSAATRPVRDAGSLAANDDGRPHGVPSAFGHHPGGRPDPARAPDERAVDAAFADEPAVAASTDTAAATPSGPEPADPATPASGTAPERAAATPGAATPGDAASDANANGEARDADPPPADPPERSDGIP